MGVRLWEEVFLESSRVQTLWCLRVGIEKQTLRDVGCLREGKKETQ